MKIETKTYEGIKFRKMYDKLFCYWQLEFPDGNTRYYSNMATAMRGCNRWLKSRA